MEGTRTVPAGLSYFLGNETVPGKRDSAAGSHPLPRTTVSAPGRMLRSGTMADRIRQGADFGLRSCRCC
jgi:hypothetical protein